MLCSPESHACNGSGLCTKPCAGSQQRKLYSPPDRNASADETLRSLSKAMERQHSGTSSTTPAFRRVLLATDFSRASEAAFATAIRVCGQLGSSLTILHVFEYADSNPPEYGVDAPYLEKLHRDALSSLERSVKTAEKANITVDAMMKAGAPALSILNTIETRGIDLVVLGTNALHGIERIVFGSTAEEVLRSASCPVLTVGPRSTHFSGEDAKQGPVVFATDFHRTTTSAIRYAQAFCKMTKASLHCLHVLPRSCETTSDNMLISQIMTEALKQLASKGEEQIAEPVLSIAYGSEVSNAVVDYAHEHKAALIVLGVRRSSMVAAHIPAHIAYRIITEAPCPVLTMAFASREKPKSIPSEMSATRTMLNYSL